MTKTLTLRSLDIPSIQKFGIGFDNMFNEILRLTEQQGSATYPPHNIVRLDENNHIIELAVAGFAEGEITVEVEKNILTVKGSKIRDLSEPTKEYVVRNIASRDFERSFSLAEYVEVTGAEVVNGILSIALSRRVPEEQLPKRIAISYNK